MRDLEHSERVSRQIRIDGHHEIHNQQSGGHALAHVARKRQPEKQEQRAERIDDVIHIESVTRTLSIAVPRQRAIETVAKPVEKDEDIHQVQHQRIVLARGVARARTDHAQQSKYRQVI